MKMLTRSPTLWAVLGTITIGVGGSIVANILFDQNNFSVAHFLLAVGSVILILGGVIFYWLYASLEHQHYEFQRHLERREREFLWDCHNPNLANADLLVSKYADSEYNVTEELLQGCLGTIVIPGALSGKFYGEASKLIEQYFATQTKLLIKLSFVIISIAVILILISIFFKVI